MPRQGPDASAPADASDGEGDIASKDVAGERHDLCKRISRDQFSLVLLPDKPEIPDIEAFAKACLLGIVRVPTEHLFHDAIAVTRMFDTLPSMTVSVADGILSANVSRNVSDKDVARLADSMLEHLYRDFDCEYLCCIHNSTGID